MEIAGYRECARGCGRQVLEHVAWQTRGVCFDCFVSGDMARLREVEVVNRSSRRVFDMGPANIPAARRKGGKAKQSKRSDRIRAAHRARERALRRMRFLLPDLFALVYAEERWRAGLDPLPDRQQDLLARALETYERFAAYDAATPTGVDDGA